MQILLGVLMAAIGLFLFLSARAKSQFIVYKVLEARSRMLWRDNVHSFYQVVGVIIVVVGILFALGVF